MDDIFVGRLMSSPVWTVTRDTLVQEAAELMLDRGIGSLVVVDDDGALEGILTSTDFIDIVAKSRPKAETTVETYMSESVVTTTANAPVRDVADAMVKHGFHHLPVVDETEGVVGMITTTDLTAYVSTSVSPTP